MIARSNWSANKPTSLIKDKSTKSKVTAKTSLTSSKSKFSSAKLKKNLKKGKRRLATINSLDLERRAKIWGWSETRTKTKRPCFSSSCRHRFRKTKWGSRKAVLMRGKVIRISLRSQSSMILSTNATETTTSKGKREFFGRRGRAKQTKCSKNDYETKF